MDCAEEISLLRRTLSRHKGIFDLTFDVLKAKMTVEFETSMTSEAAITEAIATTGMKAAPWVDAPARGETLWDRKGRQIMAAVSGASLLAGFIIHGLSSGSLLLALLAHGEGETATLPAILCFVAAMATGIWFAAPKAWASLRNHRADMNVLMSISLVGAVVLREWSEAATVAFLFALANLLESYSMAKARKAITGLLQIAPTEALVKHGDHEHRTPVDKVKLGAVIVVKPGEKIPCDGEVIAGRSSIDQAILTGESVPVAKTVGDPVFAGTINGEGALDIRTTRPASDTTISRILRMVEESQQRRAPMEQWVERFARYYTPLMIVLAMVVAVAPPLVMGGAWNRWFYQSMVILLISCPCALVISTPVSIVAALTSAARLGVLIKGGTFLEVAAHLKAVAFDKTGVLTLGSPEVEALVPLNGHTAEQALRSMASLEERSEHPLARAIVRHARQNGLTFHPAGEVEALPGVGARGEVGGEEFWIGSPTLIAEQKLGTEEAVRQLERIEAQGQTVVACGNDKTVFALLGLVDKVRPEAAKAVADLKALGVERLVMLTGDHERAAALAARQTGVDGYQAELLPDEKAAKVKEEMKTHGVVAMVGDGINDTAAMATASIGIALGSKSTDLALETADVVLMSDDLRLLPFLVRHSRRTLRVIQQNVGFAILTKAVFLGLALVGAATLWMAIAADMGATLVVTFNGLRLLRSSR